MQGRDVMCLPMKSQKGKNIFGTDLLSQLTVAVWLIGVR